MQNRSPATDRCNPRSYFNFPMDFNETYTKIIVVSFTIPSSLFYFQPQHPMMRNRPISECTSEMVHAGLRLARLPVKIAGIRVKYHGYRSNSLLNIIIFKMLLKHCKKFTVDEIAELVKITKQEIATVAKSVTVLLIDSVDSTVLLLYVQNTYFQVI